MKLSTTTGVLATKFGDVEAIKMIAKAGFDAYDLAMYHIQLTDNPFSNSGYMDYIKNFKKVAFMFKNRWRHIYSLEERICKENLIKEFKPNLLKKSN